MSTIRITTTQDDRDTQIAIDGQVVKSIERFTLSQRAGGGAAVLDMVRLLTPEEAKAEGVDTLDDVARTVDSYNASKHDVVIEGLADVVQSFVDKAAAAAREQQLAIGSFTISDGEILATLSEIIRDAKRYRAMRALLAETEADRLRGAIELVASDGNFVGGADRGGIGDISVGWLLDKTVDGYLRGVCFLCQHPIDMKDTDGHGIGECVAESDVKL